MLTLRRQISLGTAIMLGCLFFDARQPVDAQSPLDKLRERRDLSSESSAPTPNESAQETLSPEETTQLVTTREYPIAGLHGLMTVQQATERLLSSGFQPFGFNKCTFKFAGPDRTSEIALLVNQQPQCEDPNKRINGAKNVTFFLATEFSIDDHHAELDGKLGTSKPAAESGRVWKNPNSAPDLSRYLTGYRASDQRLREWMDFKELPAEVAAHYASKAAPDIANKSSEMRPDVSTNEGGGLSSTRTLSIHGVSLGMLGDQVENILSSEGFSATPITEQQKKFWLSKGQLSFPTKFAQQSLSLSVRYDSGWSDFQAVSTPTGNSLPVAEIFLQGLNRSITADEKFNALVKLHGDPTECRTFNPNAGNRTRYDCVWKRSVDGRSEELSVQIRASGPASQKLGLAREGRPRRH